MWPAIASLIAVCGIAYALVRYTYKNRFREAWIIIISFDGLALGANLVPAISGGGVYAVFVALWAMSLGGAVVGYITRPY